MDNEWLARWREGRIGFHRHEAHPALVRYWPTLGAAPGTKVLVPLCGKSLDMRWLAGEGYPVLGIELADEAIEQFLAEGEGRSPAIGATASTSAARAAWNCGAATSSTSISRPPPSWGPSMIGRR